MAAIALDLKQMAAGVQSASRYYNASNCFYVNVSTLRWLFLSLAAAAVVRYWLLITQLANTFLDRTVGCVI